MRRRLHVCLLAGAIVALTAAAPAAPATGAPGLSLTELGGAAFPDRAYALTLPAGVKVGPRQVAILEDGAVVGDARVVLPDVRRGAQDLIVIALDASESMRGRASVDALSAARAFLAQRKPEQDVAILTFSGSVTTLVAPTAAASELSASVEQPHALSYGTRLYDAVVRAAELLQEAGGTGTLVLLSDGADLGSEASLDEAVTAAREAGLRVFSVGLRSRFFDGSSLELLAARTGGTFVQTTSGTALRKIFTELGAQLANEYVIRYRSRAPLGSRVRVEARVAGVGDVATAYATPELPKAPATGYQQPLDRAFWQSGAALGFVSLVAAALLGLVAATVIRRRDDGVRTRVGAFVSLGDHSLAGDPVRLSDRLVESTDRSLARAAFWKSFQQRVEVADLHLTAAQVVVVGASITAVAFVAGITVGGALLGLGVLLLAPFAVNMFVKRRVRQQQRRFADQLPDNLQVAASALRAGHSLVAALSVIVDSAPEPSRREFQRAIANEQLGMPLEQAVGEVARRMMCRDLDQVGVVAALGRQTGGNMAEVLDRVTETIRERAELRGLVRTLTAQGRMARWIVSALPVVLFGTILAITPSYMTPMLESGGGRVALGIAAVLIVTGSAVINRIVNIEV